jgi:hypothetical protein
MRVISLVLLLSLSIQGCKPYTVLKKIKSEYVSIVWWENSSGKSVGFIPMVHAGQKLFYNNVHDSIVKYKQNGYTIFYEGVGVNNQLNRSVTESEFTQYYGIPELITRNLDTLNKLVYLLKLRRMVGIIPDATLYAKAIQQIKIIKGAVPQPSWTNLGIKDTDLNADVSFNELVDLYEATYGKIKITQIDFAVPLNETIPSSLRLNKNKVRSIVIQYRNSQLAQRIQIADLKKILIVYGADHKNGTLACLKKLDPSWERK